MGTVTQGKGTPTSEVLDYRVSDADALYRAGRCEEVLQLADDASLPGDVGNRVKLLIVRGMAEYDLGDAISSLRTRRVPRRFPTGKQSLQGTPMSQASGAAA